MEEFSLSAKTGEGNTRAVSFDFNPEMLTADSGMDVYAYGTVNGVITV